MAKRRRFDHVGAHLLVTNRGTAQTMLYRSNADRRSFLAMLGVLERDFGVVVLAYVLMGNHYHLVVRLEQARLSHAMQYLDGSYARRFNTVHERQGALFQGRYDARLLDTEAGLHGAGFYVHLNPLRAGMVTDPARYRWSSLGDHVRGRSALSWLRLELLAGESGSAYRDRLRTFAGGAFASQGPSGGDDSARFDSWHEERVAAAAFAQSDRVVAAYFGVSVDELYIVARGRTNIPRMVGILHALRTTGESAEVVAGRYGLRDRTGVYAAAKRLRRMAKADSVIGRAALALGTDI